MQPFPWQWDRGRLECSNGNEIFVCDIVDYLNMTFFLLPELIEIARAAKAIGCRGADEMNPEQIRLAKAFEVLER